jgi:protoheme IX farnesyltransferase
MRPSAVGGRIGVFLELGKARLCAAVVLTAGVGFVLAMRGGVVWVGLAWTLLGTWLAGVGANALNQWWEAERDAGMVRTRGRPLPTGRVTRGAALAFGLALGLAGPLVLVLATNTVSGGLALAAVVLYVVVYTPLKVRTPLCTLVGAVVGAIPPLIGWSAACGRLEARAWIIAGVLFLWQIPHSLAFAWLWREDFARGGFRMLPVVDGQEHLAGCVIVVYTLVLVPLAAMLTLAGVASWTYGLGSLVLGSGLVALSAGLERQRTHAAARRLFVGSLVYLPLLLGLMVAGSVR